MKIIDIVRGTILLDFFISSCVYGGAPATEPIPEIIQTKPFQAPLDPTAFAIRLNEKRRRLKENMKSSAIIIGLAIHALVMVSCQSPVSNLPSAPTTSKQILPTSKLLVIPTPAPTTIPGKDVEFTLDSANVIPPEDILKENDFY